jgi:hypothetical protein
MLAPDGNGGALVTWSDDQSEAVAGYLSAQLERIEGVPQLLRVETNTGYARLVWTAGRSVGASIHGYRASAGGAWELLATIAPDDSSHLVLEDRDAPEGQEVEYRLSVETGGAGYFLSPVRVAIPVGPDKLVLQRVWAGRDAIQIAFALPRGPAARVEVFDVLGRRVAEESLAQFTPGYYTHRVPFRGRAVSGIYFVRLSQGSLISARRLSFLR